MDGIELKKLGDNLETLVTLQKAFMDRLGVKRFSSEDAPAGVFLDPKSYPQMAILQAQTRDMLFAICCELGEIGDEINWKPWKKVQRLVDIDLLRTELIDVFHFILELMIIWGMDASSIMSYYTQKNKENHDRQARGY